jgi:sugar lactone lactonase YvrE
MTRRPPSCARRYQLIATGLGHPEGPVALDVDGRACIAVVDIEGGALLAVDRSDGRVSRLFGNGCGPNGAALAVNGDVVVADNGGISSANIHPVQDGRLLRWRPGTDAAEVRLGGLITPNDLAYEPSTGYLYLTDPGGHPADRRASTLYRSARPAVRARARAA